MSSENPRSGGYTEEENEEEDLLVSQLNMDVTNQYVVFSIGEEDYGIPILAVQEIVSMPRLTKIPNTPAYIPGIINLRGTVIPVYILRTRFNMEMEELGDDTIVIIVETGIEKKRTVGFVVDAVSDVVSITEENLREAPDVSGTVDTRFVDKIGHLGNRMVIIINLNTFFTEKEQAVLETVVNKGR